MDRIIFVFILFLTTTICQIWAGVLFGKRLDVGIMDEVFLYGPGQCAILCGRTSACLSYSHTSLTCTLHSVDTTTASSSLVDDSGYVFEDKSSIPPVYRGPCASVSCPSNSECVPLSSGQTKCLIIGCTGSPATASNAAYASPQTFYRIQDNITYTCDQGYELTSGLPVVKCRADGIWSPPNLACTPVPCLSEPPDITNTVISGSGTASGSTRSYSCASGSIVTSGNNPSTVTCTNGVWSSANIACGPAPCDAEPQAIDSTVTSGTGLTSGSTRTFTCASGFAKTSGVDPSTVTCNSGVWSSANIACGPAPCDAEPQAIGNTVTSGTGLTSGSTRTFACASGFAKTSGVDPSTVTCNSGVWSSANIACGPAPCSSEPPDITNTVISGSGTASGSTRSYSCASGTVVTSGNNPSTVTCNSGVWSSATIACGPAPCSSEPPGITNTVISGSGTASGSTRSYSCASGTVVTSGNNPSTVTCNSGVWSSATIACGPAPCSSEPPGITNTVISGSGTASGSTRSYSCASGTVVTSGNNPSTVTCNSGVWSLANIACGPAPCSSEPPGITNTVISGSGTASGSTRSYSCASGTVVTSGNNPSTVTCNSGVWSSANIACEPTTSCPAITYPPYVSVAGSGTSVGTSLTYTCDAGAILVSGTSSTTIICESDQSWSAANIQCSACTTYATTYTQRTSWFFNPPVSFTPSISGGTVTPSYCATACTDRTDFVCVAYYYRKSTGGYCVLRPMRVHDSTDYLQYDNADMSYDEYIRNCAIQCPAPPSQAYTTTTGSGTSAGSTRSYTCDAGAIITSGVSPATSTCGSNGQWSTPNIQCQKCTSYGSSYTQRTSWFFNPPVSFTPSISGGSVSVSYCANACTVRSDFFCVAYYYRKSTGGYCVLRPMRVHESTGYLQYDNADTSYDEYIRNCS